MREREKLKKLKYGKKVTFGYIALRCLWYIHIEKFSWQFVWARDAEPRATGIEVGTEATRLDKSYCSSCAVVEKTISSFFFLENN